MILRFTVSLRSTPPVIVSLGRRPREGTSFLLGIDGICLVGGVVVFEMGLWLLTVSRFGGHPLRSCVGLLGSTSPSLREGEGPPPSPLLKEGELDDSWRRGLDGGI